MRKYISLMTALSLVIISSLPQVLPASACPPAHDSAMQPMQGIADMHGAHAADKPVGIAAGQACIECGCGCHDSIDSLPHMLAPYSRDSASLSCEQACERLNALTELWPEVLILPVFSPPPQFI